MGGTGVLQFCGEQNFQLILSRRHPSLGQSDWGFTLVRRMNPVGNAKNSVYRYLAPDGKVPRFEHKTNINLNLDITLANGTALPDLEYGSVIKLFGYQRLVEPKPILFLIFLIELVAFYRGLHSQFVSTKDGITSGIAWSQLCSVCRQG